MIQKLGKEGQRPLLGRSVGVEGTQEGREGDVVWLFVVSGQSRGSGTLRISASSPPSPLRISFPKPIANAPQVERYVSWASWFIIKAGGRMVKRRSKYSQIVIITSSPHTKSLNGGGVGLGNIAVHLKIGERAADGRGTTYGPHSSAVQLSLRACFFSLAEATATAKMSEGSRERWEIGRSPQQRRRPTLRRAGRVRVISAAATPLCVNKGQFKESRRGRERDALFVPPSSLRQTVRKCEEGEIFQQVGCCSEEEGRKKDPSQEVTQIRS